MKKDIRKIITIRTIDNIVSIPDADFIETAVVGGWNIVVQKNEFKVGEKAIYFEIDTFLPETVKAFEFLFKGGLSTVTNLKGETVRGHILKTMCLRGVFSQGLLLPLSAFNLSENTSQDELDTYFEQMGLFKYEKPLAIDANVIADYPNFTQKTDAERVQNLTDEILVRLSKYSPIATEKIDGTSTTWWKDENGILRVATRNNEIGLDNSPLFSQIAKDYKLDELLLQGEIVKGEVYGENISGNRLKLKGNYLAIFTVENFNRPIPKELQEHFVKQYDIPFPLTVKEAIDQVVGLKSLRNPQRMSEGIVWWLQTDKVFNELSNRRCFKVVNNKYLLK